MAEDIIYKVLLLGDSTVGKTCFLLQYTDKTFQDIHLSTIGLDRRSKSMVLKSGKNVKIEIWDTAGQDRFRSIAKNYYKSANGVILIYDVTNRQTYDNIAKWISQIQQEVDQRVIIYIVGNKIDMENQRKVKTEEGQKIAEEYNFPFAETSAKDGTNINETFEDIVEKIDTIFSNMGNKNTKKNKLYKGKSRTSCC